MKTPHLLTLALLAGCGLFDAPSETPDAPPSAAADATTSGDLAAEADAFIARVDAEMRQAWIRSARAQWTYNTDITDEHAKAAADAQQASMALVTRLVAESERFADAPGLSPQTARQLHLLRVGSGHPAPDDDAKRAELAGILASMKGRYGKGKPCRVEDGKHTCRSLGELEAVLAHNRDPQAQLEAWEDWHSVAKPMREEYARFVALSNEGAQSLGFADLGAKWRSGYDMDPDAFDAEVERLWQQVKPLYEQLHCHVRGKLNAHYGDEVVPPSGPIPAHLLGNMWAQSWDNLYPMLVPHPDEPSLDVTAALKAAEHDPISMVKTAESFFTSLGLDPLPSTFWERSMFTKPDDRDVVCHASAWDVELDDDSRIKMCIEIDEENFTTIHHELGHNYYYHYYTKLPVLFQTGAHDGFHEGIGDTLALSITPAYLNKIGLMDAPSASDEASLNGQLKSALAKVAFLPFGRMIDKWRWDVFSGEVAPGDYNAAWWRLREEYQGVSAPGERGEDLFDAGAKYHIPGNTPYMRYFLAHILQFQFHEALCEAAGHEGPLHTCSIHGSKEAGDKLRAVLELGASKPWPDALEAITGSRAMDAGPLLAFYAPLAAWLEAENEARSCGW